MPHYTANRNFIVRMYFDGELTPRIDTDTVSLLGGAFNYFSYPLVDTCAGGQVCYEPIPFKNSVRIETENKTISDTSWSSDRHYYQYSYMTFPPDTEIDSYVTTLPTEQQPNRDDMVTMFNNIGEHPVGNSPTAIDVNTTSLVIDANSAFVLVDVNGPGMIRKLNIKMDDTNDAKLDGLRLRVCYDGNDTPAIDVSVSNFFGAGHERARYKSLPLGTDSNDGFYCYWPMPFRKSVSVQLLNTTDANIPIDSACVQYEPEADITKMAYLYAVENTSIKESAQDYHQILSTNGCGHYVGNLLYIEQDSYSFSMLEGDELITIDGSNVLYGTGLEDAYSGGYYYNWVARIPGEPEGEYPRSAFRALNGILYVHREADIAHARADQYRWQIADRVPFSQSIDVKIEDRYGITSGKWTSVAFWYKYHCVDADFDNNCNVDFADFAFFTLHWLQTNCQTSNWCNGTDFDKSQTVDTKDIATLLKDWQ